MKCLYLGVALMAVLLVFNLEALQSFMLGGISALLCMGAPVLGLGLMLLGWSKHSRSVRLYGATLLIAPILAYVGSGLVGSAQRRASMTRGDELCDALTRYKERNGEFPLELDSLVPQLLPKIPASCMGVFRDFPYGYEKLEDRGDFRLAFDSLAFIRCTRSSSGGWHCDD